VHGDWRRRRRRRGRGRRLVVDGGDHCSNHDHIESTDGDGDSWRTL
jgi:hypothetical protein